jgi:bifunctional UDP-N-acetylglucosamine pyrophosphorylase / glucosamine-1-phosphate N-acetyltransferase
MRKVVVDIPEELADVRVAGRTVLEHWEAVLAESGVRGSEGPVVHVDGRLLLLSAATLRRLARGPHPVPPDEVVPVEGEADLPQVERRLVDRLVRRLIAAGVVVHDPERLWVDATVEVAPGAVLWGGAVLRGRTVVAAGAVVHPGAVLDDTVVGERAEIKPYSVCEGAVIGADCAVGPMAHLRPGTVLRQDVKVGNFVEVKKSTLHPGVRASHLTYLGDAEVFDGANIGAGTITCNYDGFGKHRTEIGARAFVGSNTSLVAPVKVGAGAIIGAGSTVSRDVPDESLMVERAEERVLEGKAPRIRARNERRARGDG